MKKAEKRKEFEKLRVLVKEVYKAFMAERTQENLDTYKSLKAKRNDIIKTY